MSHQTASHEVDRSIDTDTDYARLRQAIEHAAHLLPAQGPITAFVHHNTLHAFEDLPFEEAVVRGAETFRCHPYLREEHYRQELAKGRILREDIEAVLISDLGDRAEELLGFLGTRFHLWMAILAQPLLTAPTAELRWVVAESDALRKFRSETPGAIRDRMISDTRHWIMRDLRNGTAASTSNGTIRAILDRIFARFDKPHIEHWDQTTWEAFTLHALWLVCNDGVKRANVPAKSPRRFIRHSNLLLEATGADSDARVHEVLIPFCAAFLDQGFAGWPLPNRDAGFYESFFKLFSQRSGSGDTWSRRLRTELNRLAENAVTPLASIHESLQLLGVTDDEREAYLSESLLALRGFAGMIWQVETRGDRAPRSLPPGTLVEFLAVRLILDRVSVAHVASESLGYRGELNELRATLHERIPTHETNDYEQQAFLVFQLAQLIGWNPELLHGLSDVQWTQLLRETEEFSSLQRRRIYHLAFERRYRTQTLDAVAAQCRCVQRKVANDQNGEPKPPPTFQLICCIDDREESFRRHVEEVAPACETFGAAGFFAVAMYYRGAADAHYTPLCPVIIKPNHYVHEYAASSFAKAAERRKMHRRTIGTVTHRAHLGSRTFAGGVLAAVFGSLASIPLVTRILFPRMTSRLVDSFGGFVNPPAVTQLELERLEDPPSSDEGHIGYSIAEMAGLVERLLRDIGMTETFARIIIVTGHGSSSLNNPHESAYNCGACAGAKGGPNARAFAQMANDPRVRRIIAHSGLEIPDETIFVGAYHNTCDDSVTYYDLERLPTTHRAAFEAAYNAVEEARARNAHERSRRFASAELDLSAKSALRHVEGRAVDLSQARPEYNHATNALCFVGRREWSRGLFLDRRAFLQSYDPDQDDEDATLLTRILQAVIPVCAGINLEYYFSCVDHVGYGAGNKLPHNITSLLAVMDGAASDLRPGLYQQMVEIHEPMRLLFIIETTPEAMLRIMANNEGIDRLVRGNWVQLATLDPTTSEINVFLNGEFVRYRASSDALPEVESSLEWYRGWRDHLGFARINTMGGPA